MEEYIGKWYSELFGKDAIYFILKAEPEAKRVRITYIEYDPRELMKISSAEISPLYFGRALPLMDIEKPRHSVIKRLLSNRFEYT